MPEAYPMICRGVTLVSGVLLILMGLVILPLPIPVGLLMIILGVSLIVPAIPALGRFLTRMRRRYPVTSHKLNRISTKLPGFIRRVIRDTDPDV